MMGLLLIAIGTGGVKPCVPSFGGDQFSSDQVFLFYTTIIFHFLANNSFLFLLLYMQQWLQANLKVERFIQLHLRKQFFSIFYFATNAGALTSTFILPLFRADLDCYPGREGPEFEECYAMAFGVPGALMVVATGTFVTNLQLVILKFKL